MTMFKATPPPPNTKGPVQVEKQNALAPLILVVVAHGDFGWSVQILMDNRTKWPHYWRNCIINLFKSHIDGQREHIYVSNKELKINKPFSKLTKSSISTRSTWLFKLSSNLLSPTVLITALFAYHARRRTFKFTSRSLN